MTASVSRRQFLRFSAAGLGLAVCQQIKAQDSRKIVWHDVRDWGIEGKGWKETAKYFDRLPARAEHVVPAGVWTQSRHSAGMLVHFQTTAQEIWSDHVVSGETLATPDLAAIGYSGLDLYATDSRGEWKWLSVTRPRQREMQGPLITGLAAGTRGYRLYLPLYNRTESLKIGIPEGETFLPIEPRSEPPLLFYGTSITQGASASRPGMSHTAILGRRLNRPVINLGFGGAGRMEPEVGNFLTELNPAVYIVDCLPNMTASQVAQRAAPLVRQLRAARPETPIILVEDRTYPNAEFLPAREQQQKAGRLALKQAFQELQQQGFRKLWYIEGETLLGTDREDTSDGSHPSDLGFWRQAAVFEAVLQQALKAEG